MPLFDLQCIECGKQVEILFNKVPEFVTYDQLTAEEKADIYRIQSKHIKGYDLIYCGDDRWANQICSCGGFQELVTPLTSMHPDKMWSGINTGQGYFTSQKSYDRVVKQKGLESVTVRELESIRKNVRKTKQAKRERQLNNLTAHIQKELAHVEISPDGNTVKEKRKYLRKRD